ncbi:nuclear distribution protein nudE-like 1 isoform X1 [Hydra vulgaris]|uniref:nuclear distribution protein nudE-like 1 isoform X1 n=1 Tax=Hydra vulgaris TaxID=6087 RepID=UPI000640EC6A|nr:nuclear distribution protein nudE-like 1 isoform X2 [Hydra vulgaris]
MVLRQSDSEPPCFTDPKEEALYWKELAQNYMQKLQDVKDEFDEFQEGSRELEAELDAQLEQYEQRVKDLLSTKTLILEENEILKQKLESSQRESYIQITSLQDENKQIKLANEEMTKYIRELEQSNDDLERAKRATICSLEEFDNRLNTAIERNAFLENELEEKEELMITVQRLKDEARDLRSDLAITSNNTLSASKAKVTAANQSSVDNVDGKNLSTPRKSDKSDLEKNYPNNVLLTNYATPLMKNISNPMTPSARISALNIVSDLLRKVGALESKLASCRNFVQDHPKNGKSQSFINTPITDTPRSTPTKTMMTKNSNLVANLVK